MTYIKEDIETMLRKLPENEAKKTEIELKIEEYQERLILAGTVYQDTEEDVIQGMQLSAKNISDMPLSITNKTSDTTANTAMSYRKEINYVNKEDRETLERRIEQLETTKKELDREIVRTKNMLNRLSKEEKFIITSYYIEKSKWDYVSNEFFEEYQKPKSIKQLQNIRDEALKKMENIINIGNF